MSTCCTVLQRRTIHSAAMICLRAKRQLLAMLSTCINSVAVEVIVFSFIAQLLEVLLIQCMVSHTQCTCYNRGLMVLKV
jgi:hypothetical protein